VIAEDVIDLVGVIGRHVLCAGEAVEAVQIDPYRRSRGDGG
jgi:hypothetical protein